MTQVSVPREGRRRYPFLQAEATFHLDEFDLIPWEEAKALTEGFWNLES